MTNKEDGDRGKSKATAVAAVNLVSQVLDEAYCIANAAKDSGQPWLYFSMIKSLKRCKNNIDDEETSLAVLKDDSYANENKTQLSANVLATSTPQKDNVDQSFLERGDEFNTGRNEFSNSTSRLINNFFEMSQIDCNICRDDAIFDGTERIQPAEVSEIISKIDALDIQLNEASKGSTGSINLSDFSFLTDVADIAASIESCFQNNNESSSINHDEATSTVTKKDDVCNYEETYLTLNRDYEHFSEDDADGLFPLLKDTRGLTFQEVELLTACSVENIYPSAKERTNRASTLTTSEVNKGLQRGSVVRRCRLQSSKLLSSLRRWWGRKKRSATRSVTQNLALDHTIIEHTSGAPMSSEL